MVKIRFFISVGIYASICIMLPFFVHDSATIYFIRIGTFTFGYLIPCVLTIRKEVKDVFLIWLAAGVAAMVFYDYMRATFESNYIFMTDWKKTYTIGTLIILGFHLYARFITELVIKQITRKV